jgi:ketosteroid isomerase-like protein
MKTLPFAAVTALVLSLSPAAFAGQAADDARAHFAAIGAGDVDKVMSAYTEQATFDWVGGPLDGRYSGAKDIRALWEKFAKAQGALKVTVDKLEEAANLKGSTVTANVLFEGKQPIKVRYVLVYRGDKIVSETWQIAPALAVAAAGS